MTYTRDMSFLRPNAPPEKRRKSIVVHVWNRLTAPLAKRRTIDSATTYQPQAKPDEARAAKIGNMGRVPELPAMTPEQIAEDKARAEGAKKLREAFDAQVARNQAIADRIKAAVNKNGGGK